MWNKQSSSVPLSSVKDKVLQECEESQECATLPMECVDEPEVHLDAIGCRYFMPQECVDEPEESDVDAGRREDLLTRPIGASSERPRPLRELEYQSATSPRILQESIKSDMEKLATLRRERELPKLAFKTRMRESQVCANRDVESQVCANRDVVPQRCATSPRERELPKLAFKTRMREALPECAPSSREDLLTRPIGASSERPRPLRELEYQSATSPRKSQNRRARRLLVGNYRPKEASQIQSTLSRIASNSEEIQATQTQAAFRPIEKDLDGNFSKEISLIEIAPQSSKSLSEQYEVDEICRSNKSGLSKDVATTSHNPSDIYFKKKNRVTAVVDCDSKETMARVKELLRKMINRQPDDLEELEFRLCHLEKKHLEEFLSKTVVCKISKLSIGYTKNVTDLIPSYCQIARNYKSTKLSLVFNDLKNEDIEALLENLDENEEYEEIDMSFNRNIGPAGFENIGKIVEKHRVRVVKLADCNISDDDLHKLFDGMEDTKLEELDISCTDNLTTGGFNCIGKQVGQRIKRLKLSDTQLNLKNLTALYNAIPHSIKYSENQDVMVEEIDVSYNSTMESEAYKVLGSMVKLFGVKKLSLAGCGLSEEHLKNLRDELNSTEKNEHYMKMKSLNARDNKAIGEGIVEIAKIVKECRLEELDISKCRLSANELEDFIAALENAKLKCLYLGEEREYDKNYISQVCNLLPHIAKMLCLVGSVRKHLRSMLQKKLNKLRGSRLEIKLDDHKMTLRSQIEDDVPQ